MPLKNTTEETINEMMKQFQPIFDVWKESADTNFAQLKEQTYKDCLVFDLTHMGQTLSNADDIGGRPELALLADIITHVKRHDPDEKKSWITSDTEIVSKAEDFKDESELLLKDLLAGQSAQDAGHDIRIPISIKIAQTQDRTDGSNVAGALKEHFLALMHDFILHDGNITDEELYFVRLYERLFEEGGS